MRGPRRVLRAVWKRPSRAAGGRSAVSSALCPCGDLQGRHELRSAGSIWKTAAGVEAHPVFLEGLSCCPDSLLGPHPRHSAQTDPPEAARGRWPVGLPDGAVLCCGRCSGSIAFPSGTEQLQGGGLSVCQPLRPRGPPLGWVPGPRPGQAEPGAECGPEVQGWGSGALRRVHLQTQSQEGPRGAVPAVGWAPHRT